MVDYLDSASKNFVSQSDCFLIQAGLHGIAAELRLAFMARQQVTEIIRYLADYIRLNRFHYFGAQKPVIPKAKHLASYNH